MKKTGKKEKEECNKLTEAQQTKKQKKRLQGIKIGVDVWQNDKEEGSTQY